MISIADLWATWSGPAGAIVGGVAGWAGTVLKARMQAQRNRLDAGQQALQLVDQSHRQQAYLAAAYERALANEMSARAREVMTADMLQDMHVEAIGARLRCHDLEMRFSLPQTQFPLMPAFPWRMVPESAPSAAPDMTGVEAASTAQPGAETPTDQTAPPTAAAAGS